MLPVFFLSLFKIKHLSKLSLFPQEYLDGEEADFQRRAWGKGTPALPKTSGSFVPLLPVAMVTREQDPSLLFSPNPKEEGHALTNGMQLCELNKTLQRVYGVYPFYLE